MILDPNVQADRELIDLYAQEGALQADLEALQEVIAQTVKEQTKRG